MRIPAALVRAAARWRPAAPRGLVAATVEVASLVTGAPVATLPRVRRALVVAPHPDDETIGCGGTLARLARHDTHVEVVVCTDGEATIGSSHEPAMTARLRRAETAAACERLGVGPPVALGLPDGKLSSHLEVLAARLEERLVAVDPQVVLVPWVLERHPDHRAVVAALARTAPRDLEVWGYEVHTPLHPSHVVALAVDDLARKRAALHAHRTAGLAFRLDTTLALNRWRSLAVTAGEGHAEAFHVVAWHELAALAHLGEQAWGTGGSVGGATTDVHVMTRPK